MKLPAPRDPAPIALFVYGRPWHTQQTVEALQRNHLAEHSDLYVFADAPKRPQAAHAVQQVRDYIATVQGFRSVQVTLRPNNFGLSKSIISGTSELVDRHGKVIVLEDDLITAPYFLTYMNEALDRFSDDDRVISIHGYVYPTGRALPEAFFLRGADCWGWATWKRGWQLFNPDGKGLLQEIRRRRLTKLFDFNNSYPYVKMLEDQTVGKNDSWAVRWYASAFLAEKLTLYPGKSLVHNVGNDSSGTHCGLTSAWDTSVSESAVSLDRVVMQDCAEARKAFERYFRKSHSGIIGRLRRKFQGFRRSGQHG